MNKQESNNCRYRRFFKYIYIFIFSTLAYPAVAQKDTMKIFGNHSNESDSTHDKHLSIKGQCFIGGRVGLSTILFYVYSIRVKSEGGSHGTSQSLVYNGFLDYGISDNLTLGAAIAYQSAS